MFVYFGGANYFTRAYLNGRELGEHEGGFAPFNFEVTNEIREGDKFLVAAVNNPARTMASFLYTPTGGTTGDSRTM